MQSFIAAFHATFDTLDNLESGSWVIDVGATTHMCTNLKQLNRLSPTKYPIPIKLPDGSIKNVTHTCDVLTSRLVLQNTLYVPCFKFNLMSFDKLAAITQVKFTFFPSYCLLQDLKTDETLAKGKVIGNLYVFDNFSTIVNEFHIVRDCDSSNYVHSNCTTSNCNVPTILNCKNSTEYLIDRMPHNETIDCAVDKRGHVNNSLCPSKPTVCLNSGHYNSRMHTWLRRLTHALILLYST